MPHQIALFFCAVQFLTRLPTPALKNFEPDWTTRAARYFPLVGQIVGAISAGVWLAASLVLPPTISALLAVAAGLLVTGAFHEDGLADTFDGLWGGSTPERRLEIMKDSRIGTYGACALALALMLKVACLASLSPAVGAIALVAGHGFARAAAVVCMRSFPHAPAALSSKWTPSLKRLTFSELAVAMLLAIWPLVLLSGRVPFTAGMFTALCGAATIGLMANHKLKGYTGDVLGAVEQAAEIGYLLGCAYAVAQG